MTRPTDAQRRARRDALLAAEARNPMAIWWLSFADGNMPKGKQFLGVLIVRERGFTSALKFSRQIGLNPGGEVQGHEIPSEAEFEKVLSGCYNRLLDRDEATRLIAQLQEIE